MADAGRLHEGRAGLQSAQVVASEVDAAKAAQAHFRDKLAATPLDKVKSDPELLRFAIAGGGAAFQTNCAPCHGRGAQGFAGYPNLNDDDWLWGGSIDDIHKTIGFGHPLRPEGNARLADAALRDRQAARRQADQRAAEYVLSLSGRAGDQAAVARGQAIFAEQCASCHGTDGKGKQEQGAPNLTDAIWLYGDSRPAIVESIRTGRGGMMPAWAGRLDPATLKSLAVYVHSLGGGK